MNPYGNQALQYLDSGLGYPIPSAYPFEKFPPLVGWTGKQGNIPSRAQVAEWCDTHAESNILLRLAQNVVGIDVDDYDDKTGADTMFKATKEHGVLPDSPMSSARGPGYSGIRYFLLAQNQSERELKGDFGPNSHVEVIRYSHRYAVAPPSWHQGAEARYEWYGARYVPYASDLSVLPNEWYMHLIQKCSCFYEQRKAQREQLSRYRRRPLNEAGTALAMLDFENNIEKLVQMPKGGRNNYLSKVAGRTFLFDCLLNNVLDIGTVTFMLLAAASEAGLDDGEAKATVRSAMHWATHMNEGDGNDE